MHAYTHYYDIDIIEFPSTVFVFNETDGFVQVPVYRHGTGNLDYSTIVHCEIQLLTLDIEDVLFLPSEQVTFGPNDTMRSKYTSIYIIYL